MTSYFSPSFVCIIFPFTMLAYRLVPARARWVVLLLASIGFVSILSKWLVVYVGAAVLVAYVFGYVIAMIYQKRDAELAQKGVRKRELRQHYAHKARRVLVLGIILNMSMLIVLNYLEFFVSLLMNVGLVGKYPLISIGAPIGISFYTLMAISYLVDVYRETIRVDPNFGHVALYLTFFPCIMEGPIARYEQLSPSLWKNDLARGAERYRGGLRILWGFAKKLIIADRLNPLVSAVFDGYAKYDGGVIALGAIAYTVQLYCDFSGTMDVGLGMAALFGVKLPENFRQPQFSKSVSEFWQRWHISLGTWFRDYVYYPVLLSKPCKLLARKARRRFGKIVGPVLVSSIALFFVWLGNGLWHGAGTQYLAFGMYHFTLISLGAFVGPLAGWLCRRAHIKRDTIPYKAFCIVRTLTLVFVGELIFRAKDAGAAGEMIARMVAYPSWEGLMNGTVLTLGLDANELWVAGIGIGCVMLVDAIKEGGFSLGEALASRGTLSRWAIGATLLGLTVIFGAYGQGYVPIDPMYATF